MIHIRIFRTIHAAHLLGVLMLALPFSLLSARGSATGDLSLLCDDAARNASRTTGVPISVLQAISLTETGRGRNGAARPWPWTVNLAGEGRWFDTRGEAVRFAQRGLDQGQTSFDLGCFQLNYRWHGDRFRSLEGMIDPEANALYAAEFIGSLYAETGNWSAAAGAYHSRTEVYAARYRARFDEFHAMLLARLPEPAVEQIVQSRALFEGASPIGTGGTVRSAGSLVPLGLGG